MSSMIGGLFSKWTLRLALLAALTARFAPACLAQALDAGAVMTSDSSGPAPVFRTDAPTDDPANAPATVVSSDIAVPANLNLTPNATEVVKMANSGVDQNVMLSYVNNSAGTFNLGADEIIYLKDIGVPAEVVDAMLQRDQTLNGQTAAGALSPAPAPMPAMPPSPEPQTVAPVDAPLTPPSGAEPAYSTFYNTLTPYGTWVDVAGYGQCWQPSVAVADPNWSPYWDGGHWVYTDLGWYWYSDYSWGWAPFHYGRWFRHARFGWCWAPDSVWGPAWVSWRYNDDYCGWAPLGPGVSFTVGLGLSFGDHCWRDWDRPWNHHFVAWRDFGDRDLHHHGLERHEVNQIFNRTFVDNRVVVHNHVAINQGIPRERVVAATRTDIRPVALHETRNVRQLGGRAEQLDPAGHRLTVYRPPMMEGGRGANPDSTRTANLARNSVPNAAMLHSVVPSSRASASPSGSFRVIGQRGTVGHPAAQPALPPVNRTYPVASTASGVSAGSHVITTGRFSSPGGSHPGFGQESRRIVEPSLPQNRVTSQTAPAQAWPSTRTAAQAAATPNTYSRFERTTSLTPSYSATRQLRTPSYTPPTRAPSLTPSAPMSAAARPAAPSYSAPAPRSTSSYAAAAPRYGASNTGNPPRYTAPGYTANPRYSWGNYQAPVRSVPEVSRYNNSFTMPRSYASSARPAMESPRYNHEATYAPPRSSAPPVSNHSWAPSPSQHYSAPAASGFSHDSSSGGSSAHSAPPSSSSYSSEHRSPHR